MSNIIVYQGLEGAYSHLACRQYYPEYEALPCRSFAHAFDLVNAGSADLAMIPVENTLAGRVSDIYHLLPEGGLHIVSEHFLPIHHNLLALSGATREQIKTAYSHPMALSQVRHRLKNWGITPRADVDTAGAARRIARSGDKTIAAIGSALAAEIYGLEVLEANIEDESHNTTRFLTLAREPQIPPLDSGKVVTSFVFKVRNVPSALYKALGGFATNGLNMTKLESYMVGGSFTATQFYADVEAHPDDKGMRHALEELEFFTDTLYMLGTYPADRSRKV
ncbi:MAG TPA: prephenate dehydratase [Hellea balneolensis]|uniref:prephenate dehydratase n=1 Tax=Hellea balneolensis TaxID=287478 RepID=A0A7V5NXE0_9PROT|nr:prephenate dehydratase [Hellea balneolensis]